LEAAKRNLKYTVPGLVTSCDVAERYFTNASQQSGANSLNINEPSVSSNSNVKNNFLQRFQARVVSEFYLVIVILSLRQMHYKQLAKLFLACKGRGKFNLQLAFHVCIKIPGSCSKSSKIL